MPIRAIQRDAAAGLLSPTDESANHLEFFHTLAHDIICLLLARTARPERPESRNGLVRHLDIRDGVPVEVELLGLVPEVLVDPPLTPVLPREPLVYGLHPAEAALDTGLVAEDALRGGREGRQREVFFEGQLPTERLDRGRDVHFVLVQQGVQVDRREVGALLLEAITGIVPALTYSTIVHKVLVQLGFFDRAVVVPLRELED